VEILTVPARAGHRWRLQRGLGYLLCSVLACVFSTLAAGASYEENAVKAAFLYRFTGYMEWPQEPAPSRREFDIAVLDGKPVARELARLLQQRPIKDLPARVMIVKDARQAADAEILYIGPDYAGNVADAVKSLAGRPVLIVTDTARGLDDGSAVNFMLVDRRVRFEVSLPAAQSAGIKVSSQLLSVATRVRGSRLYRWTSCAPWLSEASAHPVCVERMAGS
jgi:hypothetical protein